MSLRSQLDVPSIGIDTLEPKFCKTQNAIQPILGGAGGRWTIPNNQIIKIIPKS